MRHQFSWSIDKKVPIVKSKGLLPTPTHCAGLGPEDIPLLKSSSLAPLALLSWSTAEPPFLRPSPPRFPRGRGTRPLPPIRVEALLVREVATQRDAKAHIVLGKRFGVSFLNLP
jgi:hypothetical protein